MPARNSGSNLYIVLSICIVTGRNWLALAEWALYNEQNDGIITNTRF